MQGMITASGRRPSCPGAHIALIALTLDRMARIGFPGPVRSHRVRAAATPGQMDEGPPVTLVSLYAVSEDLQQTHTGAHMSQTSVIA